MRALLKNRKGVTLVELLAVLVILGIIAAIAIPTIGNLIDNSRQRAAEAEWTNIQEAARLYATSEEPAAAFSLDDIETAGYIDVDDTLLDGDGGTDITATAIFDATTGDLDSALLSTESITEIWLGAYQVYPE
jgi:type IV pilus assembly protein PilA